MAAAGRFALRCRKQEPQPLQDKVTRSMRHSAVLRSEARIPGILPPPTMAFDTSPRLIADIGGTYARFALETAPGRFEHAASLRCADHAHFHDAVTTYLATVPAQSVPHAALAIANPVEGDQGEGENEGCDHHSDDLGDLHLPRRAPEDVPDLQVLHHVAGDAGCAAHDSGDPEDAGHTASAGEAQEDHEHGRNQEGR